MPIGWNTYNKALCSLHDTQLYDKLDLERMVVLRNSEQSETLNGCGKYVPDNSQNDVE